MMTIQEFKKLAVAKLSQSSPSPHLDTDVLLQHTLNCSRTFLLMHRDCPLEQQKLGWLFEALEKRSTGLPIAYITGIKEFFGMEFHVTTDVLIPKPDTELLVEHAIAEACTKLKTENAGNTESPYKIADVCTGSGCIVISAVNGILNSLKDSGNASAVGNSLLCAGTLAEKIEQGRILLEAMASDISSKALKIAEKNAENLVDKNSPVKIDFFEGDLMKAFPEKTVFDLILSNPPYIPSKMVDELLKDGRKEPRIALDGDIDENSSSKSSDGLAIIRKLIPQAFAKLKNGGLFLVETGEYNAEETARLMKNAGFTQVQTFTDLEGQLRLTQGRKP